MNGDGGLSWATILLINTPIITTVIITGIMTWHRIGLLEQSTELHNIAAVVKNVEQDVILDAHEEQLDSHAVSISALKTRPEG